MKTWVFSPQSGGVRIPPAKQVEVRERLERHAAKHYAGRYTRLEVRFRGALCYIDAYQKPSKPASALLAVTGETEQEYCERLSGFPNRLGRLRYFGDDRWSYAFFTYNRERYEPALFASGDWFGTPEDAFDLGAVYLIDS
jgi:hypothetical protein